VSRFKWLVYPLYFKGKSQDCGVGEGWKRSVGLIMGEMKKYYLESKNSGISYMKYINGRRTGLATF